jgi:hypothetical protein
MGDLENVAELISDHGASIAVGSICGWFEDGSAAEIARSKTLSASST